MPKTTTRCNSRRRQTSNPFRSAARRRVSDLGQTAIVMVVALSVLMMTLGGLLVQQSINTDPLLSTDTIQHYAYRALEAGLNAYQSVVNINPNLANCSSATDGSSLCQNAQYDQWTTVLGTDQGNGAVPEYYLFDNPQPVFNSDGSLKVLKVQIVGVAGFPGKYIYQSTTANFASTNQFLDNVWWSDLESTTGTLSSPTYRTSGQSPGSVCQYGWTNGPPAAERGPNLAATPNQCYPVSFGTGDTLNGPIYSNDSIYIEGSPVLGSTAHPVTTADPVCAFVSDQSPWSCASDNQAVGTTGTGQPTNPPTDNSLLQEVAAEPAPSNGCIYYGPTEVTLDGSSGMTVVSPDTPAGVSGTNCPLGSTPGALPPNGVLYVENVPATGIAASPNGYAGANPFDDTGNYWGYPSTDNGKYAQTANKYAFCSDYPPPANTTNDIPCYFGGGSTPDAEGDAFVNGSLSGLLTIGTQNDIFIDGNITYSHCSGNWAGTADESACAYQGSGKDDSLGLIAKNYVEVNHPINTDDANCLVGTGHSQTTYNWYSNATTCTSSGTLDDTTVNTLLPNCGTTGADPAPLCEPVNPISGVGSSTSVVIDAALLGLQESFGADNFGSGGSLGQLVVYGSIEQESRGAIAVEGSSGWSKYYTWDPRLEVVSPPSYLTPGTPSYSLLSSYISDLLTCPTLTAPYGSVTAPTCKSPP